MRVTEKKRVKISRGCQDNPVFVSWLSHKGGREHWLFFKQQVESISTERISELEPYDEDLENSRGQIIDVSIFAQPKLTVYALVPNEDVQGLMTITHSINVEVLTNPTTWQVDGLKWERYRPEAGSFKILNTRETETEVEITFLKSYINNQRR